MYVSPYLIPGLCSAGSKNNSQPEKHHRIIEYIAGFTGISYHLMQRKTRKGNVLYARQLCTYILKKKTALSHDEIALLFHRHRTTNYNSIQVIENYCQTDDPKNWEVKILLTLIY
jgi:chromosomal replication initiation ATPase DnaA